MKKLILLIPFVFLFACADNFSAHNKSWRGLWLTATPTITAIGNQEATAAYAQYCVHENTSPTVAFDMAVTANNTSGLGAPEGARLEIYYSVMELSPKAYNGFRYDRSLVYKQSIEGSQGIPPIWALAEGVHSGEGIFFEGGIGSDGLKDWLAALPQGEQTAVFESWITFYVKENNNGTRSSFGYPEAFVGELFIIPENSLCPNTIISDATN